jgi:hypothetical protein
MKGLTRDHLGGIPSNDGSTSRRILVEKSERETIARGIFGNKMTERSRGRCSLVWRQEGY